MSGVYPTPSSIVILFDPSNIHTTLDEDRYHVFHRCTRFNAVRYLIDTGQFGQIDLHVPTTFNFDDMRRYPEVYMHTYFSDNDATSLINETERQKIRDSIRICCATVGEEFIERGIMELNDHTYDEGINLVEQLLQLEIDEANRTPP